MSTGTRDSDVGRQLPIVALGYDCFISHSHHDARTYALELRQRLEANGVTTCLDDFEFHVGDALEHAMLNRVKSSSYVIYLDSPAARKSPWICLELNAALDAGRAIARIRFPAAAALDSWELLGPLRRSLQDRLFFDEDVDPQTSGPSDRAVAKLVARHRHRRVRRRFLQLVGVASVLVAAWVLVTLTSASAHRQVTTSEREFQDPAVPLLAAREKADRLLRSRWTYLYELFAEREYWYLRSMVTDTRLKLRSLTIKPPGSGASVCKDAPHPSDIPATAVCVAEWPSPSVRAYSNQANNGRPELWIWSARNGTYALGQRDPFDKAIVGPEYFLSASSGGLTTYDWKGTTGNQKLREQAVHIVDMRFAADGQIAWTLTDRPTTSAMTLAAVDPATGARLAERVIEPGSLGPAGAKGTDIVEAANTIAVCRGTCMAFDYDLPRPVRYDTASTRRQPITSIVQAAEGTIAYSTSDQSLAACRPDGKCQEVPSEFQAAIEPLRVVGLGSPGRDEYPETVYVQQGQSVVACPVMAQVPECSVVYTPAQAMPDPHGHPLMILADVSGLKVSEPGGKYPIPVRGGPRPSLPAAIRAVTRTGWYINGAGTTVRLAACSRPHDLHSSQFVPSLDDTSKLTAAALSPSGCRAALAFDSSRGPVVYLEVEPWVPWAPSRWYGLRTLAPVQALSVSDDGILSVIEHFGSTVTRRTIDPLLP